MNFFERLTRKKETVAAGGSENLQESFRELEANGDIPQEVREEILERLREYNNALDRGELTGFNVVKTDEGFRLSVDNRIVTPKKSGPETGHRTDEFLIRDGETIMKSEQGKLEEGMETIRADESISEKVRDKILNEIIPRVLGYQERVYQLKLRKTGAGFELTTYAYSGSDNKKGTRRFLVREDGGVENS